MCRRMLYDHVHKFTGGNENLTTATAIRHDTPITHGGEMRIHIEAASSGEYDRWKDVHLNQKQFTLTSDGWPGDKAYYKIVEIIFCRYYPSNRVDFEVILRRMK